LEILDGNNKSQRNRGLATTPARGVESCEAALFGIVHNAATFRRNVVLEYVVPESLRRRAKTVTIEGTGIRRLAAKDRGRIVLDDMEPGENRWLGVSFATAPPRPHSRGETASSMRAPRSHTPPSSPRPLT
jgi:hypothetical protein